MKQALGWVVAAFLGAGAVGAVWVMFRGPDASDGDTDRTAAPTGREALADGRGDGREGPPASLAPIAFREDASGVDSVVRPRPSLPRRPVFASGEREPQPAGDLERSARSIRLPDRTLEDALAAAEEHLRQGRTKEGAALLRGVFVQSSRRSEVDLVPYVVRLLDLEDDFTWRQRYIEYLAARGQGSLAFARQISKASVLAASDGEADVERAWLELSLAHQLAASRLEREQVGEVLDPFLERHIFSSRYSPLVKTYSVRPGDNLTKIAASYRTTPDAIQRLSGLQSEVIQPRFRLRILPGEVEVFVDKSDFLLWLKVAGKVLLQRAVGLGKNNATPTGVFTVAVRQKDPTWFQPGKPPIPPGDPANVLGTRWLGFQDTEEVSGIGIHGTDDPTSIGVESSAGCIRLLNREVELLFDFVPRGTKVVIQE